MWMGKSCTAIPLKLSNVFVQPMVAEIYQTLSDQEVGESHGLETTQSRPSSLATGSTAVEWSLSGEHLWRVVVIIDVMHTPSPSKCGDPTPPHPWTLMAATTLLVSTVSRLFHCPTPECPRVFGPTLLEE